MSNVTTVKVAPNALVVRRGQKRDKNSIVVIRMGELKVAGGVLGGHYSEEQALKEFKKGNKNIKIAEGMEEVAAVVLSQL